MPFRFSFLFFSTSVLLHFLLLTVKKENQSPNKMPDIMTTDTVYIYQKTCDETLIGLDTVEVNDTLYITVTGVNSPISNEGLIAYYPFDTTIDTPNEVKDRSGFGNDGALFGTSPVTDRNGINGQAYFFGGDNDSIVVAHNELFESENFTVSFWMKKNENTLQSNYEFMLHKGQGPTKRTFSFELRSNNGVPNGDGTATYYAPYFVEMHASNNNLDDPILSSDSILVPNSWYHITGTIQSVADTMIIREFFRDGFSLAKDSIISSVNGGLYTVDTYDLIIGSALANYPNTGGVQDFIGELDDIRIYNRVLSEQEIQTLCYAAPCICEVSDEFMEICEGDTLHYNNEIFTTPGTYETLHTSFWGCDSLVQLHLTVHPIPYGNLDTIICSNTIINSCDTSFFVAYTPEDFTTFITCENAAYTGCDSIVEVFVEMKPVIPVPLTIPLCINTAETVTISDTTYTCMDVILGSYVDTLIRCDTIYIITIQCQYCNEAIPNTITPNGDGINDTFIIPELNNNPGDYPQAELWILNRREEILFQSAIPYDNLWDGSDMQSNPLPIGSYLYIYYPNGSQNSEFIAEDITILR